MFSIIYLSVMVLLQIFVILLTFFDVHEIFYAKEDNDKLFIFLFSKAS